MHRKDAETPTATFFFIADFRSIDRTAPSTGTRASMSLTESVQKFVYRYPKRARTS